MEAPDSHCDIVPRLIREPAGKSGLGQPWRSRSSFRAEVGSHNNTILNKILSLAPIILRRDTLVNLHLGKNVKMSGHRLRCPLNM